MRKLTRIIIFLVIFKNAKAQVNTENFIAGGKTLVELISVLKKNRSVEKPSMSDSCVIKQQADLCFKNSSFKDLVISLYKRNDTAYSTMPFTMKVISRKKECWYELRSGIYKYRIEIDTGTSKMLFREGELKLQPCDNMQREIKE